MRDLWGLDRAMSPGAFSSQSASPNRTLPFGETERLNSSRRFPPGDDRIPRREADTWSPTNTDTGSRRFIPPRCLSSCGCSAAILVCTWEECRAIPPRMGASACPRGPRKNSMPRSRSGHSSISVAEAAIKQEPCPSPGPRSCIDQVFAYLSGGLRRATRTRNSQNHNLELYH